MIRCAFLAALVALVASTSASAPRAAESPASPRAHPLAPATLDLYIPAAWAGIWSFTDSTYTCGNPTPKSWESGLDTLCAGAAYTIDDTGGYTFVCDGSFDDNSATITCTVTVTLFGACSATFSIVSVATRSGDSYSETSTITTSYSPAMCAFLPDSCEIINRRATRIAEAPAECATPAAPSSWGAIKSLYR